MFYYYLQHTEQHAFQQDFHLLFDDTILNFGVATVDATWFYFLSPVIAYDSNYDGCVVIQYVSQKFKSS